MNTTRPRVAIAGSGLAGLHCAVQLASSADVTVYERLPVAGGEHWEDQDHAGLIREAKRQRVRFAPGTQVMRWEADRLLAVGEHGGVAAADALVIATGHRPPARAELRIDGDRCAGIVTATLALHLLQQRVRLGANVIILGDSRWATECVELMTAGRGTGTSVLWLGGSAAISNPSVTVRQNVRVTATHGMPRITGVTVEDGESAEQITCDCLILAGPAVPYRNVDGAVLDDAPVVYAQREVGSAEDPAQIGRRAANMALAQAKTQTHLRTRVAPRIGKPL
ncbi:FAD-dependent oxidoreductase [Mycobacterium sp. GA-2829]|uniref:FAD-dependent oxidoreductase n=1 Tax=Mycobacterium sp. GA-2829 TaxID=1772283 RepID=UPI00073FEDC0|nr:FAD-dependent oxidoreductase [Mycobacterium sp. GA-2829]KUI27918.1 monooxygenase [Mycobacterium sp. GA-2829]